MPPTGGCSAIRDGDVDVGISDMTSMASNCCGLETLPGIGEDLMQVLSSPNRTEDGKPITMETLSSRDVKESGGIKLVRTFLLADSTTGRRFVVPSDPSGGRAFNDRRVWCYRRGRFCEEGEEPDPNFVWTEELQQAYESALALQQENASQSDSESGRGT
jgi:hypothetical protein